MLASPLQIVQISFYPTISDISIDSVDFGFNFIKFQSIYSNLINVSRLLKCNIKFFAFNIRHISQLYVVYLFAHRAHEDRKEEWTMGVKQELYSEFTFNDHFNWLRITYIERGGHIWFENFYFSYIKGSFNQSEIL